tara:strand:+ start:1781 stop:1972 length:192 start_codon:yes stop_codon:yes gene_type:complete
MKDKCVTCGKKTAYNIDDHINTRTAYIKGAGQFCKICYDEIYVKKTKPKISYVKIGKREKRNN